MRIWRGLRNLEVTKKDRNFSAPLQEVSEKLPLVIILLICFSLVLVFYVFFGRVLVVTVLISFVHVPSNTTPSLCIKERKLRLHFGSS